MLPQMIAILSNEEGYKQFPYWDTASPPRLTVAYGRNLTDRGISKAEATYLLQNDIDEAENQLAPLSWYAGLDAVRQSVLANMCVNMGLTKLLGFRKMIAALNNRDFTTAAAEMLNSQWATQVHQRANDLAQIMRTGAF